MARKKTAEPPVEANTSASSALTSADVRDYFRQAAGIQGDRSDLSQQMSELVTGMVGKGGNRKALSWARQLDKMSEADAMGVIEGLCFLVEHHPSLGKQGDLIRRLAGTVDQTAASQAIN